ncbi:MAG: 4-(cytidine 5'-diphospho)-2-C-methyl-D-erythritol kinase [Clostridiales bacterium]|nr:4-(cytidine 5'-diphospho)-2-C-methyl-D-erythritol kinase [Clostridiales bacterium]
MITERSYAKLNLTLDVTGLLPGGYHAVRSVMQSTDFGDELTIEPGGTEWRAESNLKYLPTGAANLAVRAALLFREVTGKGPEAALIRISKNIPVCGGLAGGSGNAAAVLRAMNREFGGGLSEEELRRLGGKLGSDIPFCVSGGTMLAEGRGEILSPLPPMPDCGIVICRPNFSSSTPELFAAVDKLRLRMRPDTEGVIAALAAADLEGVARRMFNIFEAVLPRRQAAMVAETRGALLDSGALGACMSGTGSAVFGVFADHSAAANACADLSEQGMTCFLCRPC